MPPGLLARVKVQRLDGFLSSLLGREAGPLVPPGLGGDPGNFQVRLGLLKPTRRAIHPVLLAEPNTAARQRQDGR
jgi:hypothetical protein